MAAQAASVGLWARELVEEPDTDEMEELGEKLDSESGIDPTAT